MADGSLNNLPLSWYEDIDDVSDYYATYFDRKNKSNVLSKEDIKNEGYMAGLQSAHKFVEGSASFKTFISMVIRNHLYDYIAANMSHLRINRRVLTLAIKIHNQRLDSRNDEEIAAALEIPSSDIVLYENVLNVCSTSVLRTELHTDDSSFHASMMDIYELIQKNGHNLKIFQMYMDKMPFSEIAKEIGVSPSTVTARVREMLVIVEDYIRD